MPEGLNAFIHHKLLLVLNISKLLVWLLGIKKNGGKKRLLLHIQVMVVLLKVTSTKVLTLQVHTKYQRSLLYKTTVLRFLRQLQFNLQHIH